MVLYLTTILVAMAVIISFNNLFNDMFWGISPLWTICVVTLGVIVEIAIDGLFAIIIQSLPEKWFNKDITQVESDLKTDMEQGLNNGEVQKRREKYGLNQLQQAKKKTFIQSLNERSLF